MPKIANCDLLIIINYMTEFKVVSVQEKVPKAKIQALEKFDHLRKILDEGGNPYKYIGMYMYCNCFY